jgi:hypothetical protein
VNAVGKGNAPGLDANDARIIKGIVIFDELMTEAVEGECEAPLVQYDTSVAHGGEDKRLFAQSPNEILLFQPILYFCQDFLLILL